LPDFLWPGRENFPEKFFGEFSGTIVEKIPGGFFLREFFFKFCFGLPDFLEINFLGVRLLRGWEKNCNAASNAATPAGRPRGGAIAGFSQFR
jgi:hypothetical protein